jgi:hypothetical protein
MTFGNYLRLRTRFGQIGVKWIAWLRHSTQTELIEMTARRSPASYRTSASRQKGPQKSVFVFEGARDALVLENGHQQIGAVCHAAEILLAPDSVFSARCGSVQFGRMK